jgi:hypothetical protein
MFITTSATFLISTGEPISREGFQYDGPIELACGGGPSQQQQQLAAAQQAFYGTMTNSYAQTFAGQQNILTSLQNAWKPILAAGPGQYGFTSAEDAAMRSQATQGTAATYAQASTALNANLAAKGGNGFIPSGENAQLNASVAEAAANQQSSENLGITEAGYAQGRANFNAASAAMGGVAAELNPAGYIAGANQAGNSAYDSAYYNQQMTNAASPLNAIGGILGGALGSGLDAFTGGVGKSLATSVMGGGGGSTSGNGSFAAGPGPSFGLNNS